MADHMGQGHHRGESSFTVLKRAFGWEQQPKFFKNPFFLGFLGSLLVGITLLNDRVLPHAELSKREYESRMERMQEERDRLKLEELKQKDKGLANTLGAMQTQEDKLRSLNSSKDRSL